MSDVFENFILFDDNSYMPNEPKTVSLRQYMKELGYTEINEHNASEVFDKIAEIQSRGIYNN